MRPFSRYATAFLACGIASIPAGCSSLGFEIRSPITKIKKEPRFGPGKLSAAEIQSEIMSFTDTFNAAITEQWNEVAAEGRALTTSTDAPSPEEVQRSRRIRRSAHENKLATVTGSLTIAASPNPTVALADLVTMITLQRMVLDEPESVERFGESAAAELVGTYRAQEERIWQLAGRAMSAKQQTELKELIAEWRAANPDARYVANVRLEDFARARQQTIVTKTSGESLLALVALDPLAGLDPTQREVQKSRMLGERIFFFASRWPQVLKWQAESMYQDMLRAPELESVLASTEKATDAAAGISAVAKELPQRVAEERTAALEQFFIGVGEARHATIEELNEKVSEQRRALLADLDGAQDKFQGTLRDYGEAAEITAVAATSLTTTVEAIDNFAQRFDRSPDAPVRERDPDHDVFASYAAAVAETGQTAERLTVLASELDRLLDSRSLETVTSSFGTAVQNAQSSSEAVIDHAFLRALILVLVAPFAVVLAAIVYQRMQRDRESRLEPAVRRPSLVRSEKTMSE